MSSSSPTGASLSPFPAGHSPSRGHSPIRDTFERFRNHVRVRSASSGSSNSSLDGASTPTSNWIVNIGSAVGSVGGVKTTYKSNRPHGGFRNILVSMGTQAGSIGGYHHMRHGSQEERQQQGHVAQTSHVQSQKSIDPTRSQETFFSAVEVPTEPNVSEAALRRGSNASDESYPGARLFVRQLSAYLAHDDSDRDSLLICEKPEVIESDGDDNKGLSILSSRDEELLQELGFFSFGNETPTPADHETPPIRNVVDIAAYTRDVETPALQMKALLDTGNMGPNMMASGLAKLTGHPIEDLPNEFSYFPIVGNGERLQPEGIVRVRWYFSERFSPAKSYDIIFLVVPDSVPFDVVLGFKFLQAERIFTMPSLCAMTGGHFVHGGNGKSSLPDVVARLANSRIEDAARRAAEEAARRRREEQARRRREEEARRRERDRQRRQLR